MVLFHCVFGFPLPFSLAYILLLYRIGWTSIHMFPFCFVAYQYYPMCLFSVEDLYAESCALPHTHHRRLTWTCWVLQHRYWQYARKDPAREEEEEIREGYHLVTDNHLAIADLKFLFGHLSQPSNLWFLSLLNTTWQLLWCFLYQAFQSRRKMANIR